jgi:hypothetical protein
MGEGWKTLPMRHHPSSYALALGSVLSACFATTPTPCTAGEVACACLTGSTCNAGLVCASQLCVALPGSDGGGVDAKSPAVDSTATTTKMDVAAPVETGRPEASRSEASRSDGAMTKDSAPEASPKDTGVVTPTEASTPPGTNLVVNGNFSMGQTDWAIVSGTGTISTPTGQLCVAVATGQMAILGWPESAGANGPALSPGASYTLSYMAMATAAVTVDAKVGHTSAPYTADFETPTGSDAVTTSFSTFTHTFTAPSAPAETSAGIAFTIPQTGQLAAADTVCLENVSLVEN